MDRDRGRDLGDELDMPDLGQGDRAPRVLLVDDDPVNLLLTAAALRDRGFSVSEAEGGLAALRQLADWLPDVIVLDAMMPGIDGFETCRELRELPGFELMPVLMLTGLEDEGSIEQAFEPGDVFVFGSESRGLPPELHTEFGDDRRLRIPMRPGNRSLNLSNAAAVVVYEAWRQAGFAGGA